MPDGLEVLVPGEFTRTTDANGDTLDLSRGRPHGAPQRPHAEGRLLLRHHHPPGADRRRPPRSAQDNLEEFQPITDEDIEHFRRAVARGRGHRARRHGQSFGGTAFGDIALVPGPFLKNPRGIRDVGRVVHVHISRAATTSTQIFEPADARSRSPISNGSTMPSATWWMPSSSAAPTSAPRPPRSARAATFRELYFPYYKRINDWIHAHTAWKTFKHSCGSVERFIPSFIEAGFDILNPVQCSATGMDAAAVEGSATATG